MGFGATQLSGTRTPWMVPPDRVKMSEPLPARGNAHCLCTWAVRQDLGCRERKFPSAACAVHPEPLSQRFATAGPASNHSPGARVGQDWDH
jgi:hypothetical protein